jgi:hypothetical protein
MKGRLDLQASYATLGLEAGASLDEVKRAYRRLVKIWHPDRWQHDPERARAAEARLKEINAAFGALSAARGPGRNRVDRDWAGGASRESFWKKRDKLSRLSRALRLWRGSAGDFRFGDPRLYRETLGDYLVVVLFVCIVLGPQVISSNSIEEAAQQVVRVVEGVLVSLPIAIGLGLVLRHFRAHRSRSERD